MSKNILLFKAYFTPWFILSFLLRLWYTTKFILCYMFVNAVSNNSLQNSILFWFKNFRFSKYTNLTSGTQGKLPLRYFRRGNSRVARVSALCWGNIIAHYQSELSCWGQHSQHKQPSSNYTNSQVLIILTTKFWLHQQHKPTV